MFSQVSMESTCISMDSWMATTHLINTALPWAYLQAGMNLQILSLGTVAEVRHEDVREVTADIEIKIIECKLHPQCLALGSHCHYPQNRRIT